MLQHLRVNLASLALAAVWLAAGLVPAGAAGKAQSATAQFSGSVQLLLEQADPSQPPPTIGFAGSAVWSEPKLRVDFTDELTMEASIMILDFDQGTAVVLYPDTMNGFTAKLSDLPGQDYLGHIRTLLQSQGATAPVGWKIVKQDKATHNGVATTHRVLEGPKGAGAEYWVDGEDRPLEAKVQTGKLAVSASFSEVEYGVKVPAGRFSYDKSAYHIKPFDPEQDQPVFPL